MGNSSWCFFPWYQILGILVIMVDLAGDGFGGFGRLRCLRPDSRISRGGGIVGDIKGLGGTGDKGFKRRRYELSRYIHPPSLLISFIFISPFQPLPVLFIPRAISSCIPTETTSRHPLSSDLKTWRKYHREKYEK